MFSLFKSQELKEKEQRVDEVGRELHRQNLLFHRLLLDGGISEAIAHQRINAPFTAAYNLSFIKDGLSKIFGEESMRQKYLERLCFSVMGKNGYTLVKIKSAAREFSGEMPYSNEKLNQKTDKFIREYDAGFSAAKIEFRTWESDKTYEPHMLFDFLKTGKVD